MNNPDLYAKYNNQVLKDSAELVEKYSKFINWTNTETILDIGTGDGKATVEVLLPKLPKTNKRIIISDVSEGMIEYFKRTYASIPKLETMVLDIGAKRVPESLELKFDYIFSLYALHFADQRQAYSNIFKMLKPGGELFTIYCAVTAQERAFPYTQKRQRWTNYEHEKFFTIYHDSDEPDKMMESMLTQIGFKNVMCRIENRTHYFPDYEYFKGFYTSLNRVISEIPKEDLEDYCNDYLEEVRNSETIFVNNTANQESYEMRFKVFVIIATK